MGKKIRILQIGCENFGAGGRSVIIYNLCDKLNDKIFSIDFLAYSRNQNYAEYQKCLNKKDGKIIFCDINNKFYICREFKRIIKTGKIIKDGDYQIVHINADDAWEAFKNLIIAKIYHIDKVVVHGHASGNVKHTRLLKKALVKIAQVAVNAMSDIKIACSIEAAKYMFGNKNVNIIQNGIDIEKYSFNSYIRMDIRKKLNLQDNDFLLGFVGRLAPIKNIPFLLDVFRHLIIINSNTKLLIIGDGPEAKVIDNFIKSNDSGSHIIKLGTRRDVPDLMQAMDSFILTSFHEGFGIVNIEAQASGLPCFVSDGIPESAKVNDNFWRLSLTLGPEKWADFIVNNSRGRLDNDGIADRLKHRGYDIEYNSKVLQALYEKS